MRASIMLSLTAAALLLLPCAHAADTYKIDPAHTSLTFSVRHMGISNVKGRFDEFSGVILIDNGAVKGASGTVLVKSINTGIQQRDNHLREPDFFDAARYPEITFKTRSIENIGGQTTLVGDFTMRGTTKELRLPARLSGPIKDPQGNIRIGLEAKADLNRKDYGINFDAALETGTLLVGEDVALEINAEAIREIGSQAGSK